jgi:hypothetical protein
MRRVQKPLPKLLICSPVINPIACIAGFLFVSIHVIIEIMKPIYELNIFLLH